MIVNRIGRAEPLKIHNILISERQKRLSSPYRARIPSFTILYEPDECFSLNHEWDINFIRNWQDFWDYIYGNTVPIVPFKRGGGIMWHGIGQIQLAPVVDLALKKIDLSGYSALLEQTCLSTIQAFGIKAVRNHYVNGSQGVWAIDPADGILKKISFFGFHDSRGVAIHGCAINVRPRLQGFSLINPCNLKGVEATSMEKILGSSAPAVDEVGEVLLREFMQVIGE